MKRIIAVLHEHSDMTENVHKIANIILENACADAFYVFTKESLEEFNYANGTQICQNVCWPAECDNIPKVRNWINSYFKTNQFNGMLHVLEDTTEILKIPTGFITDVENMMKKLDYDVWFSTVCDTCNYVYAKYNPRLGIVIDRAEMFKLNLGSQLLFTSHSNTQWIIYNYEKAPEDLLKFNDSFSIAMFYIIEYLARRRNTKKENQLYFMNQYLTVESELGTFKKLNCNIKEDDPNVMKEEDAKFKQLNVNFSPDNNIDTVLETTYKKLKEKI